MQIDQQYSHRQGATRANRVLIVVAALAILFAGENAHATFRERFLADADDNVREAVGIDVAGAPNGLAKLVTRCYSDKRKDAARRGG